MPITFFRGSIVHTLKMYRRDGSIPHLRSAVARRSEEHTSELQSPCNLVCRLLLEKKNKIIATLIVGTMRKRCSCHNLPPCNDDNAETEPSVAQPAKALIIRCPKTHSIRTDGVQT